MPKQMSLRQVPGFDAVCKMPRDSYNVGDWSILTDGETVWITRQKLGERPSHKIEIPKSVYDKLHDAYAKPRNIRKE